MSSKAGVLWLCLFAAVAAGDAAADPVFWPENGHYYEYVPDDGVLWNQARILAESYTWNGSPGHLATITSEAEAEFVFDAIYPTGARTKSWLGGYQDPQDSPPASNWHWLTGEAWDWTNWAAGEPNDSSGPEYYLDMYWNQALQNWNDAGEQGDIESFIVEYEGSSTPTEATSWGRLKSTFSR